MYVCMYVCMYPPLRSRGRRRVKRSQKMPPSAGGWARAGGDQSREQRPVVPATAGWSAVVGAVPRPPPRRPEVRRRGPGTTTPAPGPGAEGGLSARRGASSTLLALGRPRSRQSPLHGPRPLAGPPPGGWRETPQEGSCWPLASRGGEGAPWAVGRRGGPRWPGPGDPRPTWKHLLSPGGRSLARVARPGSRDTPPRGPPRGRPGRPPAGARAPLPGRL
jgi:hypothetical protein